MSENIYQVVVGFEFPGVRVKAKSYDVIEGSLYLFDDDGVPVATFNDWVYVSLLTDP